MDERYKVKLQQHQGKTAHGVSMETREKNLEEMNRRETKNKAEKQLERQEENPSFAKEENENTTTGWICLVSKTAKGKGRYIQQLKYTSLSKTTGVQPTKPIQD